MDEGFVGGADQVPETEMPVDRALAEEITDRARTAGARAEGNENAARRWRNVEAACHAALEQLKNGFQAQDELKKASAAAPRFEEGSIDPDEVRY